MAITVSIDRGSSRTRELLWHLGPPVAFILVMFFFFPFMHRFQFDADEGFNLMKALLLNHNYTLYSQVWNDQPPVLTYLLAGVIRVFGLNVNAARVLILFLSAGLIWAVVQFLRMTWGPWSALLAPFLLLLTPYYPALSVSVMIGLPAIALAMISFTALVFWHQRHQERWLVISALALGFSIMTKLFTGFLAPIFIVGILVDQYFTLRTVFSWRKLLRPALIWGLTFAGITTALVLIFVGLPNLLDLIVPHLTASEKLANRKIFTRFDLIYFLQRAQTILILAGIGAVMALVTRRWLSLYLVAWAVGAYVLLSHNTPVWYHHQLLVTVPAAVLAAAAVGEAIQSFQTFFRTGVFLNFRILLSLAVFISFAYVLREHLVSTIEEFSPQPILTYLSEPDVKSDDPILLEMEKTAQQSPWIVTDEPMYAFRTGMLVPPNLVVFSKKRLESGQLPIPEILDTLRSYNPELVLLGRFGLPELDNYLNQHYQLIIEESEEQLFRLTN
jgi:4-amino-4-deoxy-L-arabinose transferase-like glycosyltransferase